MNQLLLVNSTNRVNGVTMNELELPWVEYKKECTEEELSYLITDAADLYAAISRYEIAVDTGIDKKDIIDHGLDSMVLLMSMYLYHMVCQLIDISPLMKPMKLRITDDHSIDTAAGRDICCQVARAYTHFGDGSMKYQRDLYQVIELIAKLLYGTFTNEEIITGYTSYLSLLINTKSTRLGEKVS